jgi:UDP-glucose 4-epimerase
VLDAARRAEVGRVVFASTVWYYNAVDQSPDPGSQAGDITYLDETSPVLPEGGGHVYTTSKIASEYLCHDFQRMYGQDFTVLRYGIPYGPRMWPGLALRAFVENAFNGKPITIFGDGSAVRRFVYVGDLADGHVKALGNEAVNQTYNLEGARDVTIRELAETVCKFIPGTTISYIEEPTRRGELDLGQVVVSNQKARDELGWVPNTQLEDGVKAFVAWYEATYGQ